MDYSKKFIKINTPEEYNDFIYKYFYIIDEQLKYLEEELSKGNISLVAEYFPALISILNTGEYLCGHGGIKKGIFPEISIINGNQELYEMAALTNNRILGIYEAIKKSKYADSSAKRIEDYYMRWARGK